MVGDVIHVSFGIVAPAMVGAADRVSFDMLATDFSDNQHGTRVLGEMGAHVLAVSDAEELKDFMVLEDVKTREILKVPENGVLISIKCAESLGLEEGSEFEIMGSDGEAKKVTVAGIIEHYLAYNLIVTSESYYEESMGEEAESCVFLLKGNIQGLYDKVKDMDGFISIRDNSEYVSMSDAMNIIVMICFVFAALMAVLNT